MKIVPEVCIDSFESALEVKKTKAKRIELCSALEVGGLTPSVGLVNLIKKHTNLVIFPLIRPRTGNFVYNKAEKETILSEIKTLKTAKVDGFVVGALTKNFEIDLPFMKEIKKVVGKLPLVFHRAFDQVKDPFKSTEELIKLGFIRILTSGQNVKAINGKQLLKDLNTKYGKQITIMPGSGINKDNIKELIKFTKCKEYHFSAKTSYLNNKKVSPKVPFNTYSTPENQISISKQKDINKVLKVMSKK